MVAALDFELISTLVVLPRYSSRIFKKPRRQCAEYEAANMCDVRHNASPCRRIALDAGTGEVKIGNDFGKDVNDRAKRTANEDDIEPIPLRPATEEMHQRRQLHEHPPGPE